MSSRGELVLILCAGCRRSRYVPLPRQLDTAVSWIGRVDRLAWIRDVFILYVLSFEPPFQDSPPSLACDSGFTLCGTSFCIAATQQCVSGIPAPRRRSLAQQAALGEALCPAGLQACYTTDMASLAMGKSVGWECVNTNTDMESCGGCQYPIMGEAKGEDCTSKAGVDNVSVS